MADYTLYYRNVDGSLLQVISDFYRLEFARKENEVGELTLDLDSTTMPTSFLQVDKLLEVWRTVNGYTYLEGETSWYLRKWEIIGQGGRSLRYRLTFRDSNDLIGRRIVAYAAESAQAKKAAAADNLIKAAARENLGASASTTRNISAYLTTEADVTLGPTVNKQFAWQKLSKVFPDVVKAAKTAGTYLVYDVVYVSPGVSELRTFTGQRGVNHGTDSGDKRTVSDDYGNLVDGVLEVDYSEVENHIYVGGQGTQDARTIVEVSDATSEGLSPLNRCEGFVNAAGSFRAIADITDEGKTALEEKKAKAVFSGKIVDIPSMVYGRDYGYGDIVAVQFAGYNIDCHVDTVHITVEGGRETIDVAIHGEEAV